MTGEQAGDLAAEVTEKWKQQNPDMVENYTTWGKDLRLSASSHRPSEPLTACCRPDPGSRTCTSRRWSCCSVLVFAYPLVRVVDFSFRLHPRATRPVGRARQLPPGLDDPTFREAVKHSALLLLAVPVMLAISIVVSVLLYERVRGWRVYRSVLFMPVHPRRADRRHRRELHVPAQRRRSTRSCARVGLGGLALDWLGSERLALCTVMLVIVWREVGFGIVLFLARLLSLDESRSRRRGSTAPSWWQRLRYVILPELRGHDRVLRRRRVDHDAGLGLRLHLDASPRAGRARRDRCSSSTSTTRACATRCPAWPRRSR